MKLTKYLGKVFCIGVAAGLITVDSHAQPAVGGNSTVQPFAGDSSGGIAESDPDAFEEMKPHSDSVSDAPALTGKPSSSSAPGVQHSSSDHLEDTVTTPPTNPNVKQDR